MSKVGRVARPALIGLTAAVCLAAAAAIVFSTTPTADVHPTQTGWISWDRDGRGTFFVTPDNMWLGSDYLSLRDPNNPWLVEYRVELVADEATELFWNGMPLPQMSDAEPGRRVFSGIFPSWTLYSCPAAYRYQFEFDGRSLVIRTVDAYDYITVGPEYDPYGVMAWVDGTIMGSRRSSPQPEGIAVTRDELDAQLAWAKDRHAQHPDEPYYVDDDGRGYVFATEVWRLSERYDAVGSPPGGALELVGQGLIGGLAHDVAVGTLVDDNSVVFVDRRALNLIDHLEQLEPEENVQVSSDLFRPGEQQYIGLLRVSSEQLILPAIIIEYTGGSP